MSQSVMTTTTQGIDWRKDFSEAFNAATDKNKFIDCAPVEIRLSEEHIDEVMENGKSFKIILPCFIDNQIKMGCCQDQYIRICTLDKNNAQLVVHGRGWLNCAWVCDEKLRKYLSGEKQPDCENVFTALAKKMKKHAKDKKKYQDYAAKFRKMMDREGPKYDAWVKKTGEKDYGDQIQQIDQMRRKSRN